MIDAASLVVTGRISSVQATRSIRVVDGWRAVEVEISVERTLKGRSPKPPLRFVYLLPDPQYGYDGPRLVYLRAGQLGVFTLAEDGGLVRAANDRKPILPITRDVTLPISTPTLLLIAQLTLPISPDCEVMTLAPLVNNTCSLVGSRKAKELLDEVAAEGLGPLSDCACMVSARTFWTASPCLSKLPTATDSSGRVQKLRAEIASAVESAVASISEDPSEWLRVYSGNGGLDRILLDIRTLITSGGLVVSPAICRAWRQELPSSAMKRSLSAASPSTTVAAEAKARSEFEAWLARGCPGLP